MNDFQNIGVYRTRKGGWAWQRTGSDGARTDGKAASVADCLQACGVTLPAADSPPATDDLAPVVAAQAATIAGLRAQLGTLQAAAMAVAADMPCHADPAGDRAVAMLRAAKAGSGPVATVTPIRRKPAVAPVPADDNADPVGAHLAELGVSNG